MYVVFVLTTVQRYALSRCSLNTIFVNVPKNLTFLTSKSHYFYIVFYLAKSNDFML